MSSDSLDLNDLLRWHSTSNDIKKQEQAYNKEILSGSASSTTTFNYACFLIHSKYPADVKRGICLLEELYQNPDESGKRDYVYYLALGNARMKEYTLALQYINGLLAVEPGNKQAQEFKTIVDKRLRDDALKGAAITGGVLVGLGAIVGLGLALAKR